MTNTSPVYAHAEEGLKSKHPNINHFSAQGITKAEFDAELQRGVDSIKNGRTHSVEDVDWMIDELNP